VKQVAAADPNIQIIQGLLDGTKAAWSAPLAWSRKLPETTAEFSGFGNCAVCHRQTVGGCGRSRDITRLGLNSPKNREITGKIRKFRTHFGLNGGECRLNLSTYAVSGLSGIRECALRFQGKTTEEQGI
jgi:hypothetical protein